MSLLHRFLATGAPAPQTYVDDVFVSYTRTGTGASATVTTGINLFSRGGLVWTKSRNQTTDHKFTDTARGVQKAIVSNTTAAQTTDTNGLTTFGTTGHTLGSDSTYNTGTVPYVDWVFAKAPKFFDIVTYTGNGANRTISHNLGSVPGMIIVKRTDGIIDWQVYSNSIANTEYLVLNSTAAKATDTTRWNSTTPTASVFSLGTDTSVNASGGTYVAYLFAHDTSATGLIQCGSFVSSGGVDTINLGFEPQFLIYKSSSNISDWRTIDVNRGWSMSSNTLTLFPNLSDAEQDASVNGNPTATGFSFNTGATISGATYIYLAIRRPNKPPTLGTQVYNAIARTGTSVATTVTGVGFAPDFAAYRQRAGGGFPGSTYIYDKRRGLSFSIYPDSTAAEFNQTDGVTAFTMDGVSLGIDANGNATGFTYINWFFKRAPGVFDEVCYKGAGTSNPIAHNLEVQPELIFSKARTNTGNWATLVKISSNVWLTSNAVGGFVLNSTASTTQSLNYSPFFTASQYIPGYVGGGWESINSIGTDYVSYLFATKAGISKVGSYTGNGSSQTINAGFTTGARWVMIRRTDSTGDWFVWDSTRGIVSANDPHLSLNNLAYEVTTDDSVDADTSGFIVNQLAATDINVNAATYIYLSFA